MGLWSLPVTITNGAIVEDHVISGAFVAKQH